MSQMTGSIGREQISLFLPDAIRTALISYQRFSKRRIHDETEQFIQHHMACKTAVAHIELLLKLAKLADLPDARMDNGNHQIILAAMMQEAEGTLAEYKKHSQDEDNDA